MMCSRTPEIKTVMKKHVVAGRGLVQLPYPDIVDTDGSHQLYPLIIRAVNRAEADKIYADLAPLLQVLDIRLWLGCARRVLACL